MDFEEAFEFFNDVYKRKYHSIIGIETGTKEILCFSHIDIDKSNKTAKIQTLGVIKEYQNNKIGTQLIKKIIEELMVFGIKNISLIVQETNTVAIRLYTKHGFEIEKEMNDYYGFNNKRENKALLMILSFNVKKNWFTNTIDKIMSCF